ncbi:MAG TPA: IS110 family transposase [Micromonosporaceae bacterium]|nr:IS110 family transposase [Micromonosporaceae bacterium]
MAVVAELFDYVVGVDTHARTHTFTVIHAKTGAVVDTASFPASPSGMTRAISWIDRRAQGRVFAAVEGTSSYGAQIAEALAAHGIPVGEVRPPSRNARALAGKSDAIDAEAAARSVVGQQICRVAQPRATGTRAALRILLASRSLLDQQRTASRNALTALLRTIDLGVDVRKPLTDKQISSIAAWRITSRDPILTIARTEARRLARAVIDISSQLTNNLALLRRHAEGMAPGLQDTPGIGPVTAAIIICAYSHHGRVRSEAAFAALGGIAPQPASSGNTTRHRLNRSGDRQLNRAFDVIVRTRMSFDPDTRSYIQRRRAEDKTNREIRRTLKRYVCRAVFRQLQILMA